MNRIKIPVIMALALFLSIAPLWAQVSVALSPVAYQPFFNVTTGNVLSSGCIFTYISGTSTPLATYTSSGTGFVQNTNPIILNAAGFASIWLTNSTYRFVVVASDGLNDNCASGVTQYTADNVSAYTVINQSQNIFLLGAPSDPAGTAGELAYRTDIPCFRGFTTFWDCFVTLTAPQTLTNKTLTAPIINNAPSPSFTSPSITGLTIGGVSVATGNPTNFQNFTNGAAGTTLNLLAKLVPSGAGSTAVSTATTDTGGVVGVVIAGAGTTGLNMVQVSGQVLCTFDAGTTVEDYVQISSTTIGNCHDTGSTTYPSSGGQVIGRVLTTNAGAGNYLIELFPPEIHTANSASTVCTVFAPVTVTNNNTQQNLMSCSIAANALAQGSLLAVDLQGVESTAGGAQTTTYSISLGGGTPCQTQPGQGNANNQPWNVIAKFFVLTAGAGGTANWSCEYFSSASGGTSGPFGVIGTPTIAVNTTIPNTLLVTVQMSVANAGNAVTQQGLKAVVF